MFAPYRAPRPKYLSYCGTCGHHYHTNYRATGKSCAACGSSYICLTDLGKKATAKEQNVSNRVR